MAFAALAVAAVMTIVWAVSIVRDSAAQYEQIEALSKAPALYATTNSTGTSTGASTRVRVHGASPAALVF
jgi:hypothetical protein